MLGAALRSCGLLLVLSACASIALAEQGAPPAVPEIDPSSMGSALALFAGGLLMLSGRRRSS